MYSIERISEILKLLEQNGRVEVIELASLFKSSRETIRRDLGEMERNGLLKRTHGGAVLANSLAPVASEFPVGVREVQRFKEKDAVCKAAAALIKNGDSIFVDNSSTCLYLLQYISRDSEITLITNSMKLLVSSSKSKHTKLTVICLGGFFNPANLSTYGDIAQKNAADFYPNKSFMSCAGIRLPDQFTDSSILEVETKRLMIERSQQVFILADHTKFERSGPVFLSHFSSVNILITDSRTRPDQLAPLEEAGIEVLRVAHD